MSAPNPADLASGGAETAAGASLDGHLLALGDAVTALCAGMATDASTVLERGRALHGEVTARLARAEA